MNSDKIKRSLGTHDGTFHADEVTACALLLLFDLIDEDKISRTRATDLLERCEYVCDVGGVYDSSKKLFDHHQSDYQGPLSSAGMVLSHLKKVGVIDKGSYDFFNESLVLGVDAHDNGEDPQIHGLCTYSHIIANYTPVPFDADGEIEDRCFFEALHFSLGHLGRIWKKYRYIQSCRKVVEEEMEGARDCLLFDQRIPWLELFFDLGGDHHPAEFVIMPAGSHWKLRGIPPNLQDRMSVRHPLPAEWAGLLEEDLKKVSGIPGAIFCHKGRFISVWETRNDAMKALEYVLKKKGEIA